MVGGCRGHALILDGILTGDPPSAIAAHASGGDEGSRRDPRAGGGRAGELQPVRLEAEAAAFGAAGRAAVCGGSGSGCRWVGGLEHTPQATVGRRQNDGDGETTQNTASWLPGCQRAAKPYSYVLYFCLDLRLWVGGARSFSIRTRTPVRAGVKQH